MFRLYLETDFWGSAEPNLWKPMTNTININDKEYNREDLSKTADQPAEKNGLVQTEFK